MMEILMMSRRIPGIWADQKRLLHHRPPMPRHRERIHILSTTMQREENLTAGGCDRQAAILITARMSLAAATYPHMVISMSTLTPMGFAPLYGSIWNPDLSIFLILTLYPSFCINCYPVKPAKSCFYTKHHGRRNADHRSKAQDSGSVLCFFLEDLHFLPGDRESADGVLS